MTSLSYDKKPEAPVPTLFWGGPISMDPEFSASERYLFFNLFLPLQQIPGSLIREQIEGVVNSGKQQLCKLRCPGGDCVRMVASHATAMRTRAISAEDRPAIDVEGIDAGGSSGIYEPSAFISQSSVIRRYPIELIGHSLTSDLHRHIVILLMSWDWFHLA